MAEARSVRKPSAALVLWQFRRARKASRISPPLGSKKLCRLILGAEILRRAPGYSPDRVDALVWAFSELLVAPMKGEGIYELYRQQAEAAEQRRKPQPVQIVPQPGSMEWFELQKRKAEQSGGTV